MPSERTFWDWVVNIAGDYWFLFLQGAGITLLIALSGTIVGFAIGLLIGIIRTNAPAKTSHPAKRALFKVVDTVLLAYIELFRGTPMIVQAMVIYYGAAMALGLRVPPILAGFAIVSINTGAYMAEIVRGGIISIDKGQFEAAHSLGMTHSQTMLSIILPQAVRNILPALSNEFIINIKDTSVLNVISVNELYFQSKSASGNNFRYFEVFLITCAIYFVMTFTVTQILRFIEKKLDGPDVYTIHGSQTVPEAEILVHTDAGGKD